MKVFVLDDNHCGTFSFECSELAVSDSCGTVKVKVVRSFGAENDVIVPYVMKSGSAKPNYDYVAQEGSLLFRSGQTEAHIEVRVITRSRQGTACKFSIELMQPKTDQQVSLSFQPPDLGKLSRIQLAITNDYALDELTDRFLRKADISAFLTSVTWKMQLVDAFTPSVRTDMTSAEKGWRYIVFVLTFPWRLAVALTPPVGIAYGWFTFFSNICLVAFTCALIGDCSSHLGCTIGLKDTVTAIMIIPLGTGLPDTFSSIQAAVYESTADSALQQITTSCAISSCLGMGISWTIGATYRMYKGGQFMVFI